MSEPAAKKQKTGAEEEERKEGDAAVELFAYWRSSCSWRVRIVLALKGVEYTVKPVHLVEGGQREASYVALNPMEQVPALRIDGAVLTQSMAIVEYLEERFDTPKLLPGDALQRAQVRKLCELINAGIQPVQNLAVLKKVEAMGGDKMEFGRATIEKGFTALEKELEAFPGRKHDDKYCAGSEVTLADAFLVPQVYNANRFSVDMSKFPLIAQIEKNLGELEAFKKAHPSAQPDAPAESA